MSDPEPLPPDEPFRRFGGRKFVLAVGVVGSINVVPPAASWLAGYTVPEAYYTTMGAVALAFITGNAVVTWAALRSSTTEEKITRGRAVDREDDLP